MMKRRFLWVQLLAIALWFSCGSFAYADAVAAPTEQRPEPVTAQFIPERSPLFVALQNPKSLLTGGPPSSLSQWPQALLATAGVDYRRDIQPCVDKELAFALAGPVRDHDYLFAWTTQGGKDAQSCIEQLWQRQINAGQPLNFEQHNGVSLISTQLQAPKPLAADLSALQPFQNLATAIVDDRTILLANSASVLKSAIENEQNLTTNVDYRKAISNLQQGPQDAFIYADLSAFSKSSPPPYRALAVQLGKARQGILAETVLVADSEQRGTLVTPTVSAPLTALNYVPASSPLVASGVNLQQLWDQINTDLKGYDALDGWVHRLLKQGGEHWSVNLTRDIFPAVTGEYAVAMLPSTDLFTAAQASFLGADWLFIHDRTEKNQKLSDILNKTAQQQNIGVIPYALGDHQVSTWAHLVPSAPAASESSGTMVLNAEVTGAFAIEAEHKILGTSLDALKQGLAGDALPQQKGFQAALSALAEPNQGYLYIDWPVLKPMLERKIPKLRQWEALIAPWNQTLTSITATNYGETAAVQRSQILLRFSDS